MLNTPRRRNVMAEELAKIEQEIRMLQQARSMRLPPEGGSGSGNGNGDGARGPTGEEGDEEDAIELIPEALGSPMSSASARNSWAQPAQQPQQQLPSQLSQPQVHPPHHPHHQPQSHHQPQPPQPPQSVPLFEMGRVVLQTSPVPPSSTYPARGAGLSQASHPFVRVNTLELGFHTFSSDDGGSPQPMYPVPASARLAATAAAGGGGTGTTVAEHHYPQGFSSSPIASPASPGAEVVHGFELDLSGGFAGPIPTSGVRVVRTLSAQGIPLPASAARATEHSSAAPGSRSSSSSSSASASSSFAGTLSAPASGMTGGGGGPHSWPAAGLVSAVLHDDAPGVAWALSS
eukprot:RCo000695